MAVKIEKLEKNEVKLNIEVEPAVTSYEYDKACKRLSQRVRIPGFRPGKAPKNMVEKFVGVATLQREVIDNVLPTIFENTIEENNFELIAAPSVESFEFAEDKTLKIVAKLELRPEVKLDSYKGVTVEVEEYKTAENAIQKELDNLADRFSTLNDVTDRKSIETDLVNIDFDGYVDGEEIKGGSAKNYVLDLAHSNFIPGYAEQLVGHEVGEEFTIKVQFPAEYHDEKLKGKDAEFNIKLNAIKEKVLHEINDELAQKVNPRFANLAELKEDIQLYLDETEKNENEKRIATKIIDSFLEKTEIDIQDSIINREIQALMGEFKQRINMQGGNFDQMLEKEGHQKVYEQMKAEAVKRIKTSLIIGKIAQEENISVAQEDIQAKIGELASYYRTTTDNIVTEIQKNRALLSSINQQIITEKVTKLLIENAQINYTNK